MKQPTTLITALAALLLVATATSGQPDAGPNAATAMTAHRLEQMARMSLDGTAEPHPAQIRAARILLDQALQLDPTPAERWLLLAEAAQSAGDRDGLVDALKGYLKRKPNDDVAQLQLIELYGRRQQTAEALAAFYGRIAEGRQSRRFSTALRSRVAFKAALVELEQGDPDVYARLLALALELDPTNKAAAVESFRVLASSPQTSAADQASALLTMFQADPADPSAHVTVGDSLFAYGLYEPASTWYRSADRLYGARGVRPPQPMLIDWALSRWGAGRMNEALHLLQAAQAGRVQPAEGAEGGAAGNGGEAAGEGQPPQPQIDPFANASVDSLMPHAVMLAASGQQEKLDPVFSRLIDAFEAARGEGDDGGETLVGEGWARLLCGQGTERVAALIERIRAARGDDDASVAALGGWFALVQGDLEQAEQQLSARADEDARAALGLCRVLEAKLKGADGEEADEIRRRMVRRLRGVRATSPADLFGLLAAAKLRRMGLDLEPTEEAKTMAQTLGQVPADLRDIAGQSRQFVRLTAEADPTRFKLGEGATLTIKLRNVSRFPLSLGPGGTIPTRLLVMPSVRVGPQEGPKLRPWVIDLHRRLRLEPNEAVSVETRLDSGSLGQLLSGSPGALVRANLTLLLNPRLDGRGGFAPGPLGEVSHVRHVVREGMTISREAIDGYTSQLGGADLAAAMRAAAVLTQLAEVWAGSEQEPAAEASDAALQALVAAVERMSAAEQAWLVTAIPPQPKVEGRFDGLLQKLGRSDAPLVHIALVATRADAPDSPWINAALRRGEADPARDFAEARRTVLRASTQD